MASEKDNGIVSDTEGGEKPVREQLKKASITALPADTAASAPNGADTVVLAEPADEDLSATGSRGRLPGREIQAEPVGVSEGASVSSPVQPHTRKRSRDSTIEEESINNGQRKMSGERPRNGVDSIAGLHQADSAVAEQSSDRPATPDIPAPSLPDAANDSLTSPKIKRSRLQTSATAVDDLVSESNFQDKKQNAEDSETVQDRTGDLTSAIADSKTATSAHATDTSAVTPFGGLLSSPPAAAETKTTPSAFAASGFSAFAASSSSGFGSLGKQTGGPGAAGSFASAANTPSGPSSSLAKSPPPTSSFGGTLGQAPAFSMSPGQSAFGQSVSGFGKLGTGTASGFGSSVSGGSGFGSLSGGLSSFATGQPGILSSDSAKHAKAFGAPADSDDDDDNGDDDEGPANLKGALSAEEDKQDDRFYAQELETGEEEESTEFSCRAKLYNFAAAGDGKKEWRERGLGVLRLNVKYEHGDGEDETTQVRARLLMRAEGSHRVALNTPVKKELKFGTPTGGPPTSGYLYFMGAAIDNKSGLEMLQLKLRQQSALELYEKIIDLQKSM